MDKGTETLNLLLKSINKLAALSKKSLDKQDLLMLEIALEGIEADALAAKLMVQARINVSEQRSD